MTDPKLTYYIDRYTAGNITSEELNVLRKLLKDPVNRDQLHMLMQEDWSRWEEHELDFSDVTARVEDILQKQIAESSNSAPGLVHRVHFLRRWGWAAAIFVLAGAATIAIVVSSNRQHSPSPKAETVVSDILPATNKALLTLSDGTTITLDSATNGTIAQQGNASIVKLANGEIRYDTKGISQGEVMLNTMATPRGGQYQLMLPDGSKIWLNAASSITYPVVFAGNERKVKITGEVYFEVTHDESKPFIIDVDGEEAVKVLGTSFNINAYKNYSAVKTTLVNGRISVAPIFAEAPGRQRIPDAVLRSPGQQAVLQTGTGAAPHSFQIVESVDLLQVLAWKNGIFDFTGADFQALMSEVERWYDVDVKYEGSIPGIKFRGKMDRGVKLSGVIRFLHDYGIDARLSGQTLIIKGS